MNKNIILKILIVICFSFVALLPTNALTLEGSVEYTEETARNEAFEGLSKYRTYDSDKDCYRSGRGITINYREVKRVIHYQATYLGYCLFPEGIIYKDAPDKEYVYIMNGKGNRCICVIINTNYGHLPKKTANYNAKGKLVSVGLDSGSKHYKFNSKGKLIEEIDIIEQVDSNINSSSNEIYYRCK